MANEIAPTRTVRQSVDAVEVSLTRGQFLQYRITVYGARGFFNLSCGHRTLWSETDFPGHPQTLYYRKWPQGSADVDTREDVHRVSFSFRVAIKYTLRVEKKDGDGNLLEVVKDIDCESYAPTDALTESLRVFSS